MGGSVAVTIRADNGEIIKMARQTGSYRHLFSSEAFNNGNTNKSIADYCQIYYEMKKDFEMGEPYKFDFSEVYGSFNEMAPMGYGLVVIDFLNKKIHSMQGYDHVGYFNISMFSSMYLNDNKSKTEYSQLFKKNHLNLFKFDYINPVEKIGSVHDLFGEDITFKKFQISISQAYHEQGQLSKILKQHNLDSINLINLVLQPQLLLDYEIINYQEDINGITTLVKNLLKEGFSFNTEEKKLWTDYCEDFLHTYTIEHTFETEAQYTIELQNKKNAIRSNFSSIFSPKKPIKP